MTTLLLNPRQTIHELEHDPEVFASIVLARTTDPRWELRNQCYAKLRAGYQKILSEREKLFSTYRPMPHIDV